MKKKIDWLTTIFLITSHLIGILGTGLYSYFNGIHPLELLLFFSLYLLTGIAITAGYHRYFSHRSYECHPLLKLFYLIFGAAAFENSVLRWASDHRMHHKYVDTDLDPYNIKKGAWYAHIVWIFNKSQWSEVGNVKDLEKDALVVWQHKFYPVIGLVVGFLFPCWIGFFADRPLGALLWGGFFRLTFVHHMTFFINSLAHMVGKQTYTDQDTSRDSWWLAFLTYGEGYHNFHHKFQGDYRNGVRWYQWDPTKWIVALCQKFGLTHRLNYTPPEQILKAKLAMELLHLRKKAHWAPQEFWEKIHIQMEAHRQRLEKTHARWLTAKARSQQINSKVNQSKEMVARWKMRLKIHERRFEVAKENWKNAIESAAASAKILYLDARLPARQSFSP